MKAARILSIIVLAGMLAGALALAFPGAVFAQDTNPPVPPTSEEQKAQQVERLEKVFQRQLKLMEAQGKRLEGADDRVENFAERIADLKAEGKDTSALEEALAKFKDALKEAHTAQDKAVALHKAHAGFDDQGKVTDLQKARETVREIEKLLRGVHRDLEWAVQDLAYAFRKFMRDNRVK